MKQRSVYGHGVFSCGSDGTIPAGKYSIQRDEAYAPYGCTIGAAKTALGASNNWKGINNWQAVFVDSLVASFAKIGGGAVFTGNTDPSSTIKDDFEAGVDTANFQNLYG